MVQRQCQTFHHKGPYVCQDNSLPFISSFSFCFFTYNSFHSHFFICIFFNTYFCTPVIVPSHPIPPVNSARPSQPPSRPIVPARSRFFQGGHSRWISIYPIP